MEEKALRIKLFVSYYFQNDLLQQLTLRQIPRIQRDPAWRFSEKVSYVLARS